MTPSPRGLADTSIFIAQESGRRIDAQALPQEIAVSIITIGELRAGVLAADDAATRSLRLDTLTAAMTLNPLPVDDDVASQWARLRILLRDAGLSMPVNDSWIAATAMAHKVPVLTQDDDFPVVSGLAVIKV